MWSGNSNSVHCLFTLRAVLNINNEMPLQASALRLTTSSAPPFLLPRVPPLPSLPPSWHLPALSAWNSSASERSGWRPSVARWEASCFTPCLLGSVCASLLYFATFLHFPISSPHTPSSCINFIQPQSLCNKKAMYLGLNLLVRGLFCSCWDTTASTSVFFLSPSMLLLHNVMCNYVCFYATVGRRDI